MAKVVEHQVRTKLSTADIATAFRDHITSRPSGLIGVTWSRKLAWRFSTPPEDASPFAGFGAPVKPVFRVLAHFSLAKRPLLANDAQVAAWDGSISLDVFDRDSHRVARMSCLNGPGPKAQIGLVLDRIKKADPGAEVEIKMSRA